MVPSFSWSKREKYRGGEGTRAPAQEGLLFDEEEEAWLATSQDEGRSQEMQRKKMSGEATVTDLGGLIGVGIAPMRELCIGKREGELGGKKEVFCSSSSCGNDSNGVELLRKISPEGG